jgi:hypothetical protein
VVLLRRGPEVAIHELQGLEKFIPRSLQTIVVVRIPWARQPGDRFEGSSQVARPGRGLSRQIDLNLLDHIVGEAIPDFSDFRYWPSSAD